MACKAVHIRYVGMLAFNQGILGAPALHAFQSHLGWCSECRSLLEETWFDEELDALMHPNAGRTIAVRPLLFI